MRWLNEPRLVRPRPRCSSPRLTRPPVRQRLLDRTSCCKKSVVIRLWRLISPPRKRSLGPGKMWFKLSLGRSWLNELKIPVGGGKAGRVGGVAAPGGQEGSPGAEAERIARRDRGVRKAGARDERVRGFPREHQSLPETPSLRPRGRHLRLRLFPPWAKLGLSRLKLPESGSRRPVD